MTSLTSYTWEQHRWKEEDEKSGKEGTVEKRAGGPPYEGGGYRPEREAPTAEARGRSRKRPTRKVEKQRQRECGTWEAEMWRCGDVGMCGNRPDEVMRSPGPAPPDVTHGQQRSREPCGVFDDVVNVTSVNTSR
ncbi:hypothetical protein EYF80_026157 [Liparis tanakae]|uniref:Uncharacterized protein n=1 Tax=Liparis tanakae TaxID=230148 RepID=A0A4Z2HDA6_9TELE|nr:hypothetical protein EYF80_026157 [Liparis tanakae]